MDSIGKYTIVEQIGVGGFGVVYEGQDPFLKRRVAIKTCTTDAEDIRDRFFREAEIAGNLQHRHVVTVHDFGIQDDVPYLVQEYLSGEDLDRKIARRDPMAIGDKVDILLQIARGLRYAHSKGIVHRDVKPANVRVTDTGLVKIMDFGIAKLENVASHLTRTGMTLGTAAYLPPEQIRGTPVDHRADMFSFGVLAYELVSYSRPFSGKNLSALFTDIIYKDPPSLREAAPDCPERLQAVIVRCLAKDPDDRFEDFGSVIEALSRIAGEIAASEERGPGAARAPEQEPGTRAAAAGSPPSTGAETADWPDRPGHDDEPEHPETGPGVADEAAAFARTVLEGSTTEERLDTAREIYARGDLTGARRRLEAILDEDPRNVGAAELLARLEERLRPGAERRESPRAEGAPARPPSRPAEPPSRSPAGAASGSPEPAPPPTPPAASSPSSPSPSPRPVTLARSYSAKRSPVVLVLASVAVVVVALALAIGLGDDGTGELEREIEQVEAEGPGAGPATDGEEEPAGTVPAEPGVESAPKEPVPTYRTDDPRVTQAELTSITAPPIPVGEIVLLYVLVDETGSVETVRLLPGSTAGRSLVDAVIDAVENARFTPAERDGVPGRQWVTLRLPLSEGD